MPQLHNVRIGSSLYRVEVANTSHLQQLGLSFRTHLSSNRGVLFVFPDEVNRIFHMRNMKFPLDIIFIGADKRVKWIIENAQPDNERLISLRPSKYVLEVNAGDVKKKSIRMHSKLDTLNNPLIKSSDTLDQWVQKQDGGDGGEGGFSGTAHTSEGTNTFTRTFGPSKDNKKSWTGKKKKNWAKILTSAPDEEHITVAMLNEWLEKATSKQELAMEAKRKGLIPQSGNWMNPRKWIIDPKLYSLGHDEPHHQTADEDDYWGSGTRGLEESPSSRKKLDEGAVSYSKPSRAERRLRGKILGNILAKRGSQIGAEEYDMGSESHGWDTEDKSLTVSEKKEFLEEVTSTLLKLVPSAHLRAVQSISIERDLGGLFHHHDDAVATCGSGNIKIRSTKDWKDPSVFGSKMGQVVLHEIGHALHQAWSDNFMTRLEEEIEIASNDHKIDDDVLYALEELKDEIDSPWNTDRYGSKISTGSRMRGFYLGEYHKDFEKEFKRAKRLKAGFSSEYSSKNSMEFFAETYAVYLQSPESLKQRNPATYKLMRLILSSFDNDAPITQDNVREHITLEKQLEESEQYPIISDPAGVGDFEEGLPDLPEGEGEDEDSVAMLNEWIEKQERDIPSEMRGRGLEPKTGDWEHPYRWIRSIDSSTLSPTEKIHSIIESSPDLKHVLNSLSEVGQPYLVGGCVRDILIGKDCKDFDIEMYGVPQDELGEIIQSRFGGSSEQVGKQFGVFKVGDFDISLPRTETQTGEKHTDFDVVPDHTLDPMTAARRRDFTINAMMYDVKEGKILDFFGGEEDLSNGLIKHIDDKTFVEDPLRVYRAAQFAARFGFNIDPSTKELASQMDLSNLPIERVNEEFTKMLLKADNPSLGLDALDEMGVLKRYFPEIAVLDETPQRDDYHAEGDVFTHTKMVLDRAADVIKRFPSDKEKITIMLASLCHDLGKPSTTEHHSDGSVSQHGHDVAGIDPTREFLSKLTRETDVLEDVEFLVEHHLLPPNYYRSETSDATFRKIINRYGMRRLKLLAAVSEADILGRLNRAEDGGTEEPDNDATEWFNLRLDEVAEKSNLTLEGTIQPLITGHDLKDMGFEEGRELGDILRDIKSHQETGQIADSSEAIEYVKDTYMSKSLNDLVDWLFKAVSTESVAEAKRKGLVPQSGDWESPRRWVRPEDAEKVPDSDVSDKREGASLESGGVPANYGNKLYPVGKINASLREFFDRDDVDVSLLQNMYSIGGELSKEFGISFRTVDIDEYQYRSGRSSLSDLPISSIEVDYQLDSKLPVPKKYAIGYMFTPKPMSRENYLSQTGIREGLNPSKESDYYTETIDKDLVHTAAQLLHARYRNKDIEDSTELELGLTIDGIRDAVDKLVDFDFLPKEVEQENLVSALTERFTRREYEYLENPAHPYDEYVKNFMDKYGKEVFSEYHLGYQDTLSPDGEFMSADPLAMDSPEQARQWVEEHGYMDEAGEAIEEDFIIQETENIEAQFQKSESHFARTLYKYRDENTGEIRFEVLHREMTFAEPYQGKGLATNINEHAEEVYEQLGIDRITLQANYDIGGYTWARQGYDFIHRDDRIALQQSFTREVKRGNKRGDISDEELDSLLLEVKSLKHAWEFAIWNPTDEVDGKHFGKKFMLGSDWMAHKSLNPDSLGYKIGKLYYAGKNQKASVTG